LNSQNLPFFLLETVLRSINGIFEPSSGVYDKNPDQKQKTPKLIHSDKVYKYIRFEQKTEELTIGSAWRMTVEEIIQGEFRGGDRCVTFDESLWEPGNIKTHLFLRAQNGRMARTRHSL
jgi:hypothetical protein